MDFRLIEDFRYLKFRTETKASIPDSGEKCSRKSIFYQFLRAPKARCKFSLKILKLDCNIWRWCCAPGIWRHAFYTCVFGPTYLVACELLCLSDQVIFIFSSFQVGLVIGIFFKRSVVIFCLVNVPFWILL